MLSVFDNSYCLAQCLCSFELLFQGEPHLALCVCSLAEHANPILQSLSNNVQIGVMCCAMVGNDV